MGHKRPGVPAIPLRFRGASHFLLEFEGSIAQGRVFLRGPGGPEIDSWVRIELVLPHVDLPVALDGTVVHRDARGVGLSLATPDPEARKVIDDYVTLCRMVQRGRAPGQRTRAVATGSTGHQGEPIFDVVFPDLVSFVEQYRHRISRGGLLVALDPPPALHSVIAVRLQVPALGTGPPMKAQVAIVRPDGVGLRLAPIAVQTRRALEVHAARCEAILRDFDLAAESSAAAPQPPPPPRPATPTRAPEVSEGYDLDPHEGRHARAGVADLEPAFRTAPPRAPSPNPAPQAGPRPTTPTHPSQSAAWPPASAPAPQDPRQDYYQPVHAPLQSAPVAPELPDDFAPVTFDDPPTVPDNPPVPPVQAAQPPRPARKRRTTAIHVEVDLSSGTDPSLMAFRPGGARRKRATTRAQVEAQPPEPVDPRSKPLEPEFPVTWGGRLGPAKGAAEVLLELSQRMANGRLYMKQGQFRTEVGLSRGRVVSVLVAGKGEKLLGDVLLEGGEIAPEELQVALKRAERREMLVGEALVEQHILEQGELNLALTRQLTERLERVIALELGVFSYCDDAPLPRCAMRPGLDPLGYAYRHLLARFSKRSIVEMKRADDDIRGARVTVAPGAGEVVLELGFDADQLALWSELEGGEARIPTVYTRAPLSPRAAHALVHALASLGLVGFGQDDGEDKRFLDALRTLYRGRWERIESDDHFKVLELDWWATEQDVETAHRSLKDRLSPAVLTDNLPDDILNMARAVHERIDHAYALLRRTHPRRAYRANLVDGPTVHAMAGKLADQLWEALGRGALSEAMTLCRRSLELIPNQPALESKLVELQAELEPPTRRMRHGTLRLPDE